MTVIVAAWISVLLETCLHGAESNLLETQLAVGIRQVQAKLASNVLWVTRGQPLLRMC